MFSKDLSPLTQLLILNYAEISKDESGFNPSLNLLQGNVSSKHSRRPKEASQFHKEVKTRLQTQS